MPGTLDVPGIFNVVTVGATGPVAPAKIIPV
jgi:hypothetical protein